MLEVKEPLEIASMLQSQELGQQALGYQEFLKRAYWTPGTTVENIKNLACRQFQINSSKVIPILKQLEPAILWASQDGLQYDKIKMVEAAGAYCDARKVDLPPITVWNMYDDPGMRYIIHDGHHRAYYAYRYEKRLFAVILEPLSDYEYVENKLHYAYQLHKRVTDLPIIRISKD